MTTFRPWGYLAVAIFLAISFLFLRNHYINVGVTQERARQDAATVQSLTDLITSHQSLIDSANRASLEMQNALLARTRADAETTRSLKNALAKTAGDRVNCVFDPDSLRHLDEARARAADAATRGLRATPPRTPAQNGQHPG